MAMLSNTLRAGSLLTASLIAMPTVLPQAVAAQVATTQAIDTPQSRLRPIGAPSAVDQFGAANRGDLRQTAFMQNGGIPLPNNFSPPPISTAPLSTPPPTLPPTTPPRALPANPGVPIQPAPSARTFVPGGVNVPNQDYAPLGQPQLNNQFATMSNSCHVSGPSSYTAASASGCTQAGYQPPPGYVAPPAPVAAAPVTAAPLSPAPVAGPITPAPVVAAPTFVPGAPIVANPTGAPAGSLMTFGQEKYQVQIGRGLFGQPVAYVPGQKFRNWCRYIFP
jgi:hypothetical protein